MIDNPPLLSIHRGFARPDPALVAAFRGAQTSHLCDAMEGRGAVDYRIKPLDPGNAVFVGVAMTAHAYPADVVAMFGALAEAAVGDVIVCANDGFTGTAVFGDLAAGMMRNKKIAAFVTDGLARDKAGIIATGLPVFCQGISPNSPARNGPGVVGAPVSLGGVHVCPGDIIVGDADSVVVVPQGQAAAVLKRLRAVQAAEVETERKVREGLVTPDFMVDILSNARIVGG
ncbi:MAG: RraA family protein [Acetobacteraceae bacterium]|nr:RraA family protein [Acetobacteraceae bacterium]